ncbi:MAG TPA: hypothetical protein VN873_07540 [Candidatus Angelobacter sp.]|nr:hypothetical protein [Candidatus Angelobacter sp.]
MASDAAMTESAKMAPASPRPKEIPIANIYYLLCYAWDALEEKGALANVGNVNSNDLLDLFARVLVTGSRRLLRRGLDRGYVSREDEILGVRGKLLVTPTLRRSLLRYGRAACSWDELEYDTMPNRILKTTLLRLYGAEKIDVNIRADLHDVLRWLTPVTEIKLYTESFRRVQLHRNNRIYSFLLNICQFVHQNWLPTEHGNSHRFQDFFRNGLSSLFEKFIFNFYRHELPADWHVRAPFIQWQKEDWNHDAVQFLPRMETDVCIKGPNRAIILDAKFYAQALRLNEHGSLKLSSANLYQLFTYLRQKSGENGWENAEGILLYPRTDRDFCADFKTHGHRIRALTVDLFQPWDTIHRRLLNVIATRCAH